MKHKLRFYMLAGDQKCVIKKILPLNLKQILKKGKDENSKVLLSIKHALGKLAKYF